MLSPHDIFDLSSFTHAEIFKGCNFAWEVLPKIKHYAEHLLSSVCEPNFKTDVNNGIFIKGSVYVGKDTIVEPGTFIKGPTIIGENCQIRQGAYIRGNVILGNNCVVGHTTEVKNSIFLNEALAPHFACVGDSVLGNRVNLGAGTILAVLPLLSIKDSVTLRRPNIRFPFNGQEIDIGLSKFGAILGDDVQTGCNVVTNPGCIVGRRTLIYALVSLRKGYYPPDHIIKHRQQIEQVVRK